MKHLLSILLAVTGYSGFSEAQITDDESSKNFLAIHCAVSGGRSAHDFEEYGRKLAKTIGLLSPSQQKNVFGYIPQPADTPVIPDYNPEFHGNLGSFGEASQSRGSAPGAASPAPANSPSGNSLVNAVGSFNSTLEGSNSDSGAIVGGAAPSTTDIPETEDNRLSEWWSGVLVWIGTVLDTL